MTPNSPASEPVLAPSKRLPSEEFKRAKSLAWGSGIVDVERAAQAGIPLATLRNWHRRGALVRVSHGVYRLASAPLDGITLLHACALWPRNARWTVLHGAAALWVDVYVHRRGWAVATTPRPLPERIDVAVPVGYRTHRTPPSGVVLHRLAIPRQYRGKLFTVPRMPDWSAMAFAADDFLARGRSSEEARRELHELVADVDFLEAEVPGMVAAAVARWTAQR